MPLDIGVGILLSLGVAEWFGVPATPWLVLFGVLCALLPDSDILTLPLLGKWHHRMHTHYPLLYLPLFAAAFIVVEPLYAWIFMLGILAHLIHDTFGIGWGIAWIWPFSARRFLLFPSEIKATRGVLATWQPGGRPPVESTNASAHWVRHYYLRPNRLAYIEYGALLAGLAALAAYFG